MPECYCAKVEDGVITQVIVCGSAEWAIQHLGGQWVCPGGQLVGIGWTYSEADGFRSPKPYPSWVLDDGHWVAPVERPAGDYVWSEDDLAWVEAPQMPKI